MSSIEKPTLQVAFFVCLLFLPNTTPMDSRIMNGLRRPRLEWQRSDKDPKIGVRKNPIRGDRHQINVMC